MTPGRRKMKYFDFPAVPVGAATAAVKIPVPTCKNRHIRAAVAHLDAGEIRRRVGV